MTIPEAIEWASKYKASREEFQAQVPPSVKGQQSMPLGDKTETVELIQT